MLMVLMALVELGKTRVHRATRWLWLLFSGGLFVAPVACGPSDTGGDLSATDDLVNGDPGTDLAQVLYGPPMDYLPALDTVDAAVFDLPQVMYGPAMDLGMSDCGDDVAPPADALDPLDAVPESLDAITPDAPTDVPLDCGDKTYYGPPPPYGPNCSRRCSPREASAYG